MSQEQYHPGFADAQDAFKTPFSNFNFDPGGEIYKPPPNFNAKPPDDFSKTAYEFVQKNEALRQAQERQRQIDDLYRKTVGDAVPREVEIVPPSDFNQNTKPIKNITPPDEMEEIIRLREQKLKKSQPPPKRPPPVPDAYDLAPPAGTPGAKPGYRTIPSPENMPGREIPDFHPNPIPKPPPTPSPKPLPPPSPKAFPPSNPKPPGLPPAIGRFPIAGGIAAAADFTIRVASGQPPGQAAASAIASAAGGVVGGTIGAALGGPVGAFLGGGRLVALLVVRLWMFSFLHH